MFVRNATNISTHDDAITVARNAQNEIARKHADDVVRLHANRQSSKSATAQER